MRLRSTFYLFISFIVACFSLTAVDAQATPAANTAAVITLAYDGTIRDRVGQNNLARNPDGKFDGTFTVTLNAGSGNRTVTQMLLANSAGGAWDAEGGSGFWTLGVANGWDAALVNGNNDAVSLPVSDGGEFKIFASEFQNRMFLTGTLFTLLVDFSDGSSATGSVTIAQTAPPVVGQPIVTLAATTPNAIEGGASGGFTLTRTGSTASALTVNYTLGGTAVAGTHYAALSGNAVIAAGSLTGTIVVVPVENSLKDGDKTVVMTVSASAAYSVGSPNATVTVLDNDGTTSPAAITLRFDGSIRDRVGKDNLARNPDGQPDGTFTVTLNAGSGNRTVTQLLLANSPGGAWNTNGGDGFWTLGAASGWDTALVNGNNDAVNFPVADGGEFKIFAADFQNQMFLTGTAFALTVGFSDGSLTTGNIVISAQPEVPVVPVVPVVTLTATTPTAVEGGANGAFTLARTGSTASALPVNYSVGGTAVAGTHYAALSGSAVIAAGSATGTIAVAPVQNSLADGDKTVVVTVSASAAYTVGSPSIATVTVHDNDSQSIPASISLKFDGYLRDRVGQNNLARNPDGQLDGTFTVTLNAGSGNRTITQMLLANIPGGAWNTNGGDGFWTLGVASGWDAALLNGNNDAVNFPVADGGEFKIFAADFQNRMFLGGTGFTLSVVFSDGSVTTGNVVISAQPVVTLTATTPTAIEGGANGAFTLTRTGSTASALAVNYTVGGTAVAGTHYTALSGNAVIAAGALSATIAVVPVENSIADGDKTVVLTVSTNAAYSVGSPTATITVHDNDGTGPVLFSSPGIVAQGTTLTVSWNGIQGATNKDWIGLFAAGANDGSALAWIYVSCTQTAGNASASGACPFVVPSSLANGIYELRLFSNGGSSRLAVGLPFAVTPLDTNILITTPERAVAAAPKVATVSIARQECNIVFSIPYIQTGNVLTFNAAARTIPNGGGVVFVLSDSLGGQSTQKSVSPPFSARYTGLAKGEYRLDVYIVDSSGNSLPGELNHDYATRIGIGDIYVAIGDSITEGYDGVAYNTPPYTSWLQAPIASLDSRNYPQCGISSGFWQDHWQEASHHISLNNKLEAFERYPVFILNEGVAAITTGGYVTRMNTSQWQNRIAVLKPNKWLVHLGTNDGGGSTKFQSDMQTIVDTLKGAYAANGKDIVLAIPQLGFNWQPYINNLISANGLTPGPDFNTFYTNHKSLFPTGHPDIQGHEQFARLWAISIMSPRNVAVQQVANGRLSVSWDDLQSLEPTIAGYKVYYGTNPGFLTNVLDVGHVLTTLFDVSALAGQTYYFAVQGYDNDALAPNRTSLSSPVGITIGN